MPSDFATKVAARIKELRQARGLSLRELARRSGLAPESVSRSERGVNEISLTNLDRLCQGLDVDLPKFFSFAKKIASTGHQSAELASLLRRLPERNRSGVVRALGSLVDALPSGRRARKITTGVPPRRSLPSVSK